MHFVCSRGARRPPSRTCSTAAALFLQNAILVELHMKKLTFRGTPFKTLGFLKIVKNENMRKRPLSSKKQTSRLMSSKIEGPYGPFDFRRISLRRRPSAAGGCTFFSWGACNKLASFFIPFFFSAMQKIAKNLQCKKYFRVV